MALILRSVKGSKLTISDMDGNLTYLQSLALSGSSSGGTGHPSGSNTQIQFNDNNSFGGNTGFTFDKNTNHVNINGSLSATNLVTGYIFSNPKNITGTISIPDNTNALIIGPNVSFDPSSDITLGVNSDLTIFDPTDWLFTGNTSSNTISDIWVDTVHGGTYYGDGSNLTGIAAGAGVVSVTYNQLVGEITGQTLTAGTTYIITDFKTCYDVPEYYVDGDPKGSSVIDYRQGSIEPIVVLATSTNTISSTAYQPAYPNDRIQYDWTWNLTEITENPAYGRITERIDEFNNRTDYDHRNITFNRFQSYDKGSQLTGTISALYWESSILMGQNTKFLSEVNIGDILLIDGYQFGGIGVKVVSAITDTTLTIVTDPSFGGIPFCGNTYSFYTAVQTENFNEYKEVYVGQKNEEDWDNFLTFNLDGSAIHNYVGDYSRFYLEDNVSNSGFLLANNVFYGNESYSNTIGDRSYNNTGTVSFSRNTIASEFYNNVIYNNAFYSNTINEGFANNIIYSPFYENVIGNYFNGNEIYSQFYDNVIGNYFNENEIYSQFYGNQIGLYFESNKIGDYGNINDFDFYRNRIGNNFYNNIIRQDFQNNQIGNQFHDNTANGDFYKNVVGNGFNNNHNIGHDFYGNHIGNGFNNNPLIGDNFQDNRIGEYFNNNSISYNFHNNQIGNTFEENTLGDTQYFNWDNTGIENLTARTYNTFYNSLDGNVGNVILGKELIMHFYRDSGTTQSNDTLVVGETYEITNVAFVGGDFSNVADVIDGIINEVGCVFIATGTTPTSWCGITVTELTVYNEYHKVKFTQWTQNNNGGGFSYERTKVYPSVESTVYFTKLNYSNLVDIVVPSRLEIKRGNNQAIYNDAVENDWNENVSPEGTEWNSIYTQSNSGNNFEDNTIGNEFKGNYIRGVFQLNSIDSYVGGNQFSGNTYSNNIGNTTFANDFLGNVINNSWGNNFHDNTVGIDFYGNLIGSSFNFNTIGDNFYGNNIQNYFYENNIGDEFQTNQIANYFNYNTIGDGFQTNQIGNYFGNNTIGDNFGYGYANPQGNRIGNNFYNNTIGEYFYNNSIPDNFKENTIGNYFQWNVINTDVNYTDFTINSGNITGFIYTTTGNTATDGIYNGLSGTTTGFGKEATFNIEVSGGTVVGVTGNTEGILYATGDSITIIGTQMGGSVNTFSTNNLTVKVYKPANGGAGNQAQMDDLIANSPLFDTYDSANIQQVSYTTHTGVLQDSYVMEIDGYIAVPSNSTYYFGLSSDDGSDAFINGIKVADYYGSHPDSGNVASGNRYPITLTAGTYSVKVRLQEGGGGDVVSLLYGYDNSNWNIIPDNWFPYNQSGSTGVYTGVAATGATSGQSATFDITVVDNLVTDVEVNDGGVGYLIGDELVVSGSLFGGTNGVDDIVMTVGSIYSVDTTITVTGATSYSLFYDHYTKQIFENKSSNKRVSYYDEDDVLNIDSVYEISGYIPVYSQNLTFPYTYTSFNFHCDGVYSNNGGTTNQTVNNIQELVALFNNNFRDYGYFFNNNDGTIGLYINPSLKQQNCPNGTYTIYVFND
jgi:hypothetical protein